jgi:hypothetical protein
MISESTWRTETCGSEKRAGEDNSMVIKRGKKNGWCTLLYYQKPAAAVVLQYNITQIF